ncbi:MAG: hypothetical protein F6J92_04645 [Symploca sp. SIO1A3]|nr:hypothetical protein [Symploca sp. SIO1A3]
MIADKHCSIFVNTPQEARKSAAEAFQRKNKPHLISIPGISAKEKYRYRVVLKGRILADKLSLEQALAEAGLNVKGGAE